MTPTTPRIVWPQAPPPAASPRSTLTTNGQRFNNHAIHSIKVQAQLKLHDPRALPGGFCCLPLRLHLAGRALEVLIPLAPQNQQLEQALALLARECEAFAADPHWSAQLLAPPWLRGVKQVSPMAIELSIVLTTRVDEQWAAQRELLRRIVVAMQQEGLVLASSNPGGRSDGA